MVRSPILILFILFKEDIFLNIINSDMPPGNLAFFNIKGRDFLIFRSKLNVNFLLFIKNKSLDTFWLQARCHVWLLFYFHRREPSFHSWYRPASKIIINQQEINEIIKGLVLKIRKGRGMIKVISTSKIRKITAIKKNRIEKDRRLDVFTSNPHSKGEGFSRSK